jgi:response regulator RpfG family c-di-GMP phosphodiesterase
MAEKILFVDDEGNVLQGYQRLLRSDFRIDTAVGAPGALIAINANGPYAVVVSDMHMPGMNGIELLSKVKSISPDTVRIMLTGKADTETAIGAVNEGNIFRFLTKPCDKEILGRALGDALVQFRLVIGEKDVLEKTLKASIRVLSEVLSVVNPTAFSRAMRVHGYIRHIAAALGLSDSWRLEVASLMSQLGCVTLDPETLDAVHAGRQLSPDEQAAYDSHPLVARDLLAKIPRLEALAWMVAHQNQKAPVEGNIADRDMAQMRLGAEILHVALAYDEFLRRGKSRTEAATLLTRRNRHLDAKIFHALVEVQLELEKAETRICSVAELSSGMLLAQDLFAENGPLIAAKGQEVTPLLLLKLQSFQERGAFQDAVKVAVPQCPQPAPLAAAGGVRP